MNPPQTEKRATLSNLSNIGLYDLYAPAVYGNILRIVPQAPIADMILAKVFLNAFNNRETLDNSLRAPLTNLLNHSRTKSKSVLQALEIVRDCCEGSTAFRTDKEVKKSIDQDQQNQHPSI